MSVELGLQHLQTVTSIDTLGVEASVSGYGNVQKVHVRCFFIHMHHCGDDIFLAHKFREKGFAFLKETPRFLRAEPPEKFTV